MNTVGSIFQLQKASATFEQNQQQYYQVILYCVQSNDPQKQTKRS